MKEGVKCGMKQTSYYLTLSRGESEVGLFARHANSRKTLRLTP